MELILDQNIYTVIGTKEKITVADSFVVKSNKIGTGNGEAKLYIGNNTKELRDFFGLEGFSISCFMLKKDLLKYLEETKVEYQNPQQPYLDKSNMNAKWNERKREIDGLPELIEFIAEEQTQIAGPRVYLNSTKESNYHIIRKLSLPNITYISIVKLQDTNNEIHYYFRLFTDYFGEIQHPYILQHEQELIEDIKNETERIRLSKARIGQGDYRQKLLEECPICPITLVSDDRLLIASHIKPWAVSNNFEKMDPKNGFMLTPTFDFLFDRGFLSFTDEKKTILSPFLSNSTYSKLGISDNKLINHLPIDGRKEYLEYHRKNILKR